MFELNTLVHRYYLEDLERAARHDIAQRIHKERTGATCGFCTRLMQILGQAFSAFGASGSRPSQFDDHQARW